MKRYSEYEGDLRTCQNCLYSDWDNGDYSVGMSGYIFCEKDDENLLDISLDVDGAIAKGCPFWKNDGIGLKYLIVMDVETIDKSPEIHYQNDELRND